MPRRYSYSGLPILTDREYKALDIHKRYGYVQGYYEFIRFNHRGVNYQLQYRDGCFNPFPVKLVNGRIPLGTPTISMGIFEIIKPSKKKKYEK